MDSSTLLRLGEICAFGGSGSYFPKMKHLFKKEKNCKVLCHVNLPVLNLKNKKASKIFQLYKNPLEFLCHKPFGHFSPSFGPELGSSRHRGRSTSPKRNMQKATDRLSRACLESIETISRFFLSLRIRMPARNDT